MDPVPQPSTPPPNNPLDQQRVLQASPKNQDIYSSSLGEIFSKNFVAGFSRTLGGIIVYLIFIFVVSAIFSAFVLPKLLPLLTPLTQGLQLLQNPSGQIPPPGQLDQLLQQYQR